MEILPERKSLFYLVSVPVFLAGLILGVILVSYVFFKTKDRVCLLSQPTKINTALSSGQIEKAASLDRDRTIFGKVTAREAGSFTLQFAVVNPLDASNSTTTTVKIPFNQNTDEVINLAKTSAASSIEETKASFGDIKEGEHVLVKILSGKKTIYIPPSL